jgi:hypothetical protein
MTAALLEAKQKLASNFDQSISESVDDVLTRDNLHLSEPIKWPRLHVFAIDCKFAVDCKKVTRPELAPPRWKLEYLHSGDASGASRQIRIVNVRCWSNSGKHVAIERISPFDPTRTLHHGDFL